MKHNFWKRIWKLSLSAAPAAWLGLAFSMATLVGCTSSQNAKEMNIYTSLDSQEAPVYIKKFEEKFGVKVNFVRMSAGETLARLESEKNNPQVAMWFGGSSPEFITAAQRGLLEPYKPQVDYELAADHHDPDWKWTGFYFGAIGFACNENFFKEKNQKCPESWKDLLSPALKGQISLAFPYTSGTAYTVVASLLELYGEKEAWDFIKKLDGQVHHYNKSGNAAVTQAGLGEIAVGISFAHDILKKGKESGYPIGLSMPQEGTGSEIGAMALVKGGKNHELAKQMMDYMMASEGQNLMKEFYRVPLNPKAEVKEGSVTASKIKLIPFNAKKAADRQKEILDQWRKVTSR